MSGTRESGQTPAFRIADTRLPHDPSREVAEPRVYQARLPGEMDEYDLVTVRRGLDCKEGVAVPHVRLGRLQCASIALHVRLRAHWQPCVGDCCKGHALWRRGVAARGVVRNCGSRD